MIVAAERARASSHLIELYDTGRSQWLWRCVKCKLEYASALRLTGLTCIPNDPGIDYAAAPDLLKIVGRVAVLEDTGMTWAQWGDEYGDILATARAAIAKARGPA